ncbi:mitochondrial acidic protein MAM33-like [Thalictrum thalictroides]|uniref:Mitochondrial acidic protein MAM33-like n=1 Tax=Thalictrum thalictroides TaxID=46969 RepID=A0A7J6WBW5_THATH|nr:mitochondrial acidic protein MAM33-like [Thalictrum thalictroides]
MLANRHSSSVSTAAVDNIILRSLKEHYHEVSKMTPPPKISPPAGFSILRGALDNDGPVLRKIHGENEEVLITVMRISNILPGSGGKGYDDEDQLNQLFLHVDITKPGLADSLHFLCGLYPDAIGIHTITLRPKPGTPQFSADPHKYGPSFHDLDQNMKDVLHFYIEERGVDESLFTFLQAWLYVKDHRNLMGWFKTVGTFISDKDSSEAASKLE